MNAFISSLMAEYKDCDDWKTSE